MFAYSFHVVPLKLNSDAWWEYLPIQQKKNEAEILHYIV